MKFDFAFDRVIGRVTTPYLPVWINKFFWSLAKTFWSGLLHYRHSYKRIIAFIFLLPFWATIWLAGTIFEKAKMV